MASAAPVHKTKVEIAYDFIRERILNGELEPGLKLTLAGLAELLGTSHMPVREAALKLQQEGLLEVTPHTGMRVAPLRAIDVRELFQVRAALEGLAARLAARALSSDQLQELEALHKAFQDHLLRSEFGPMADSNWRFHQIILQAAENSQLSRELDEIWSKCFRFRAGYRLIPGRSDATIREHEAVLAAFRKRDPEAASKAAFDHAEQAGADLYRILQEAEVTRQSALSIQK